jgi:hypothetical protein
MTVNGSVEWQCRPGLILQWTVIEEGGPSLIECMAVVSYGGAKGVVE